MAFDEQIRRIGWQVDQLADQRDQALAERDRAERERDEAQGMLEQALRELALATIKIEELRIAMAMERRERTDNG